MLLLLLKEMLLEDETFPDAIYKAKKFIAGLRFTYNEIDECPIDCMLSWKRRILMLYITRVGPRVGKLLCYLEEITMQKDQ